MRGNDRTPRAARGASPASASEWSLRYDGFDPGREGLREALCTLGNGYFATRGAAPESVADGVHYPGTYVAGLYDRRSTELAGRTVENESLVNIPNWLPLTFSIDGGPWFDLGCVEILEFSQDLDLRRATLTRTVRTRDPEGRVTRLRQERFVSMANRTSPPSRPSCGPRIGRAAWMSDRVSMAGSSTPVWPATANSTSTI